MKGIDTWFYGPMIYEQKKNGGCGSNTFIDLDLLVNRGIGWVGWKYRAGWVEWEFDWNAYAAWYEAENYEDSPDRNYNAFTQLLNGASSAQHVPGARVVAAFKGGSKDLADSYKRVGKFAEELRTKWNVELVPDIPSLCQKVDGVMIESVDGRQHLEQVKQALASGKPLWIDKPLASSPEDAREILRLAKNAGVPWFSASALRYGKDVDSLNLPDATGAVTWGTGPLGRNQLDLAYYAIHVVELLYAVLGPGCQKVSRTHTDAADVIVGKWKGGRAGEVRALRPDSDYGALIFRAGGKMARRISTTTTGRSWWRS